MYYNIGKQEIFEISIGSNIIWRNYDFSLQEELETIIDISRTNETFIPNDLAPINRFITYLKKYGIWGDLDILYMFTYNTSVNAEFSAFNLVNPMNYKLTYYGGLTFENNGIRFNGVNSYADTNWNAAIVGNKTTLNSASRGAIVYENKNTINNITTCVVEGINTNGAGITSYRDQILANYHIATRIHQADSNSNYSPEVDLTGVGLKTISRSSETDVLVKNNFLDQHRSVQSSSLPTESKIIGKRAGTNWSNLGLGLYFAGAYLDSDQQNKLLHFYQRYRQEIGLPKIII